MTNREECLLHLAQMSGDQWKKIEDLFSEIQSSSSFGKWETSAPQEDGSISLPYVQPSETMQHFIELMYALELVASFDWTSWDEGQRLLQRQELPIGDNDAWTACRLITTMIRSDRFVEGSLLAFFQRGHVGAALAALLHLRSSGALQGIQTP